jgi:hypothetical protein
MIEATSVTSEMTHYFQSKKASLIASLPPIIQIIGT